MFEWLRMCQVSNKGTWMVVVCGGCVGAASEIQEVGYSVYTHTYYTRSLKHKHIHKSIKYMYLISNLIYSLHTCRSCLLTHLYSTFGTTFHTTGTFFSHISLSPIQKYRTQIIFSVFIFCIRMFVNISWWTCLYSSTWIQWTQTRRSSFFVSHF